MPFVDVENQQLYYKQYTADNSNGLTLLLIHGLGSSHAFYAPIVPSLLEKGINCLVFDTPGSGSSPAGSQDRTPHEIAKLFSAAVAQLGVSSNSLIATGHSMGAMIACELGLLTTLRGVVLIGPVHPTPAIGEVFEKRIESVNQNGLESLADAIPTAATGSRSSPIHHAFIRALIMSQTPKGYASLCKTIATAQPPEYERLECPLLIIAGSDDKTSPLPGCETIKNSWGGDAAKSRLEELPGVGHWHCIEAPEEVSRLAEEFALQR